MALLAGTPKGGTAGDPFVALFERICDAILGDVLESGIVDAILGEVLGAGIVDVPGEVLGNGGWAVVTGAVDIKPSDLESFGAGLGTCKGSCSVGIWLTVVSMLVLVEL